MINDNIPNPFRTPTPAPLDATPPLPPVPPLRAANAAGDDGDGGGDADAAAEEVRRFNQRQDYRAARLSDWLNLSAACSRAPTHKRTQELMTFFDAFVVGETHIVSWPVLWSIYGHLDKLGRADVARYSFVIGGRFGDESVPSEIMPRALMMLFHQLANEGNRAVVPTIEKALVDYPGGGFFFLPIRDGLNGWLFVSAFMRGFNALPDSVKARHAPFHLRVERMPVEA